MVRRGVYDSMRCAFVAAIALVAALELSALPLAAQLAPSEREAASAGLAAPAGLPEPSTSSHTITLPGRTLAFSATAGALAIASSERAILADVSYIAYELVGGDRTRRPVVFAFNGGPGSASTWLHLGAMGPWRVPLTVETISSDGAPPLLANAETWLDFADLVFIDPPGTGFSRLWPKGRAQGPSTATYEEALLPTARRGRSGHGPHSSRINPARESGGQEWFWSVEGDVATFGEFIAAWLERSGRKSSPVVLVGESYGGFRVPHIAEWLVLEHDVRVATMVLVSPVLDFDGRRGWRTPAHHVALLPSIVATLQERRGGVPTRQSTGEAEAYASDEYVRDLVRGPRDGEAVRRMSRRIAELTGLQLGAVEKHHGRLTIRSFLETSQLLSGRTVSIYDAGIPDLPALKGGRRGGFGDPFTGGLNAPLTAAMAALHVRLGWQPARPYVMLAAEVNRRWRWPNTPNPPQALEALHELHNSNPALRTLVVHGFTDLVTPYYASLLQLDQLPAHGKEMRITFDVYPGGHMFYSRDVSRARFRNDSERLLGEAMGALLSRSGRDHRETP